MFTIMANHDRYWGVFLLDMYDSVEKRSKILKCQVRLDEGSRGFGGFRYMTDNPDTYNHMIDKKVACGWVFTEDKEIIQHVCLGLLRHLFSDLGQTLEIACGDVLHAAQSHDRNYTFEAECRYPHKVNLEEKTSRGMCYPVSYTDSGFKVGLDDGSEFNIAPLAFSSKFLIFKADVFEALSL